jgi:hypothetical protein
MLLSVVMTEYVTVSRYDLVPPELPPSLHPDGRSSRTPPVVAIGLT